MSVAKKPFYKTFFGTIVVIISICVSLYFIFFASLAHLTGHGDELKVPDLKNKIITEVYDQLQAEGFGIVIDSIYDPTKPALTIMDQQPLPGNTVKPGRHIYLTLNKTVPPDATMPNLINLSLRSAMLMLKTNKLVLGDTSFIEDMPKGAIAEQHYLGKAISAGDLVPQGSKIDLVIGAGSRAERVAVPDVMGITYQVATTILGASNLRYDIIWEGEITDTANAVIIYQLPAAFDENNAPITVEQGTTIDLKISQNP